MTLATVFSPPEDTYRHAVAAAAVLLLRALAYVRLAEPPSTSLGDPPPVFWAAVHFDEADIDEMNRYVRLLVSNPDLATKAIAGVKSFAGTAGATPGSSL